MTGMHCGTSARKARAAFLLGCAVVALGSACLLMLPVTWVYVQTRRKKWFDQSVVQTLIILPLVVAGVILLVQNSTALAFSLGGIVGAVSFRNILRDTSIFYNGVCQGVGWFAFRYPSNGGKEHQSGVNCG